MVIKTEDIVRDEAKIILKFDKVEKNVQQGTGQITTFNQLGFKGVNDKPDGWYLPKNTNEPAIILETKSSDKDLRKKPIIDELFKNIDIISTKYKNIIGILYNGEEKLEVCVSFSFAMLISKNLNLDFIISASEESLKYFSSSQNKGESSP